MNTATGIQIKKTKKHDNPGERRSPAVFDALDGRRQHLENHGRSAQKSARDFIEAGGQRFWPRNPEDLQALVPGGGTVDVRFLFDLPAQPPDARFVVTEAASGQLTPGAIVIGDESSPFHALAGWPLSEFGAQLAT